MNKPIIRIMPDYQCFPLWKLDDAEIENINPKELSITEDLKAMLIDWQKKYDATLNMSDPISSGFKNELEENNFEEQGVKIWRQMLIELGSSYQIKYFSVKRGILYELPSEIQ